MEDAKSNVGLRHCAKRYTVTEDGRLLRPDGSEIQPSRNARGYPHIGMRIRPLKIDQKILIHRIVAYQKYGESVFESGIMVRHLDGNKGNFRPDNIAIGTARDNHYDNGEEWLKRLPEEGRKINRKRRMFSLDQAREIRRRNQEGEGYLTLARAYECSKSTIRGICRYEVYRS